MSDQRSEIAAGTAPAIVIAYGFAGALYHQLMICVRRFRISGDIQRPAWDSAIRRVAKIYLPLGPLNWFEYAIAAAADTDSLQRALDQRAAHFAHELGEAMASVADDYRSFEWAADQLNLDRVQKEIVALLGGVKDALFSELGHQLELELGTDPLVFNLVPRCQEPTGAYSHPTVIGIDRYTGLSLAEVMLHETGHVAAARGIEGQPGGLGLVRSTAARLGFSDMAAVELFHLLLFHAAGTLVRSRLDSNYVPIASRLNAYAKIGAKLGCPGLSETDIAPLWARRQAGATGLADVVAALCARLKTGRIS